MSGKKHAGVRPAYQRYYNQCVYQEHWNKECRRLCGGDMASGFLSTVSAGLPKDQRPLRCVWL